MIKFENPENGRFYYLSINRDLFGDIILTVIRGGNNKRVSFTSSASNLNDITCKISAITKRRLQRGYQLVV